VNGLLELAGPVVLRMTPPPARPSTFGTERDSAVQPMVCGYIRARLCVPQSGASSLQRALCAYARREGLTLADIYIEWHEDDSRPLGRSAFVAMVDALRRPDMYGVLIPSLCHFSRFPGVQQAMRGLIEVETGARVLIMENPREDRHDAPDRAFGAASDESSSPA
jgi:hypothetical protein